LRTFGYSAMPDLARLLTTLAILAASVVAAAGEPTTVAGPHGYFSVRRAVPYAVVDTVPRTTYAPVPYPYGWFGAAPHATVRWTHTDYYRNYTDVRFLRGR
jgi:hypothetical protein